MECPLPLRAAIEKQIEKAGAFGLRQEVKALSRRYQEESGQGKRLVSTDRQTLAYAAVRMPATFGAVCAALAQVLPLLGKEPYTLLDVGAGTGAAVWAADALLELKEITCLEREPAMARLGQTLMKAGSEPLQSARWLAGDLTGDPPLPSAQLVSASYVLNEISPENRPAALSRLWQATQRLLLLVEPGTPEGFCQLQAARDLLLGEGAFLLAPCPHAGPCPLPDGDWCHFACRVARSRLHRQLKEGEAPFEDEKFCYLAFGREPGDRAAARVLRHPQVESGKITLRLCTRGGLAVQSVRKRDGALFKLARKASCGGPFPYEG